MSRDLAFQKAMFAAITAATATPVTAHPPHGQALPYIQIGQSEQSSETVGGWITAHVHVWSAANGPHEVKQLQAVIETAVRGITAAVDGLTFAAITQEFANCFIDVDNETWHGVQRFHLLAT